MTTQKRGVGRPAGQFKSGIATKINGRATKTYNAWVHMKQRCLNPRCHIWKYYGGRGIKICERWTDPASGFKNFIDDVGIAPDGLTLGRVDNEGHYEPGNVTWQSWQDQAMNRKQGGTGNAQPMSLRSICATLGACYHRAYQRRKAGWTIEQAITIPAGCSPRT